MLTITLTCISRDNRRARRYGICIVEMLAVAVGVLLVSGCASTSERTQRDERPVPSIRPADVRAKLRDRLDREPYQYEVDYSIALEYLASRDFNAFQKALDKAIAEAPSGDKLIYRLSLVDALRRQGKRSSALHEALSIVEEARAIRTGTSAVIAASRAAELYKSMGEMEKAERMYEAALACWLAYVQQGVILDGAKDPIVRDILSALRETRGRLRPRRPSAEWVQAQVPKVHITMHSTPAMRSAAQAEIARLAKASSISSFFIVGVRYTALGRYADAIPYYLAELETHTRGDRLWQESWVQLGFAYLREGRLSDAASAFETYCRETGSGCDLKKQTERLAKVWSQRAPWLRE